MTTRWMGKLAGLGAVAAVAAMAVTLYAAPLDTAVGQGGPNAAQRGARPRPGRRLGPLGPLGIAANRLGLSDAQRQQMRSIAESHREERRALAERLRTARQLLRDAATAESIDEALTRQRSADVAAVQAEIAIARAHARAEAIQVLTPDQQAQVKEFQGRVRDRMAARRRR